MTDFDILYFSYKLKSLKSNNFFLPLSSLLNFKHILSLSLMINDFCRIRIFEKEIENHISTLQQTRKELFAVSENNKVIAEENRLLTKENHALKSR